MLCICAGLSALRAFLGEHEQHVDGQPAGHDEVCDAEVSPPAAADPLGGQRLGCHGERSRSQSLSRSGGTEASITLVAYV